MRTMIAIVTGLCLALVGCGDDGDDAPAADAPPGTPDMAPTPATCTAYCAAIQANCTAANSQFGAAADCTATCAAWMQGTIGDQMGNNLECRAYHAGAAAASPTVHCTHAGPGGDDFCGTNCEGFCTLVQDACTGGNEQFQNVQQCMTACAGYPTAPAYNATIMSGDSFACRLYHATAASTNPGLHCSHVIEASVTCQ